MNAKTKNAANSAATFKDTVYKMASKMFTANVVALMLKLAVSDTLSDTMVLGFSVSFATVLFLLLLGYMAKKNR